MSKEISNDSAKNSYDDQKFMGYALRIAKTNIGLTAPNPSVGCVIVKDNQIIATSVTSKTGRPHAEATAINKINDKKLLAGATIYVTLEPCCHHGLTPPCSDLIISSKIARVVIATKDPDQRVNGKSIKQLQDAGIEVVLGIKQEEAKELNRAFFKVKLAGKPYVTLKLATSLDGKIATKNYHSKWITSACSQNFSHHLRSINDCIMVGANTIRKDNPMLNCRLEGFEEYCPIRVVISASLDFDQDCNIFKSYNQGPTLIFTGSNPNQNNLKKLQKIIDQKNIEIISLPNNQDQRLDLDDVLSNLVKRNINSILLEGGGNLATEFVKQDLVDELVWIRNKKIIGADGISAIGDLVLSDVNLAINNFVKSETINYPDDTIEIYKRSSLK
jgi:diaminohydroxyphosphoribosylaminopyrimidine deaminase/5-amino-6-(5-phosphoribosylamino)uracil reductase